MKYLIVLFLALTVYTNAYSQDYKKHKVEKGETVTDIAKKYKVTPYDIYRLNPDAKNGLKENTVILIPSASGKTAITAPAKEQPSKVANTIHEVKAKETLYSLSKKYNVSVEAIESANSEVLKEGLKIGQSIIIPITGSPVTAQVKAAEKADAREDVDAYIYHTVKEGETKYSIARDYGITLQLLEELNPEVKDVLPLGFNLKLIDKPAVKQAVKNPEFITYVVQPKETFYSLTKATGLTMEKIIALNPHAQDGLKEGMELKLPANTKVETVYNKTLNNLISTIDRAEPKEIALLLPFNLNRVESDTLRSQLLRSDKFLNITLDFYAGALMAIDSAKALGLPLKVRIMDSKETSRSSDVASLKSGLYAADMVIGPFFQNNVETTAAMLSEKKIPVISPLSKDASKSQYNNLFQSVPSQETAKLALIEYLKSKNGNIIAIVDAKKNSSKTFIKNNIPQILFAPLNADGTINEASLKSLMVKDRTNYIILETESTRMMVNATKMLDAALADYPIQLAVMDRVELLEDDEVPLQRLVNLKMLYPSVNRDNMSPEAMLFTKSFKDKNGIMPSQYATRGFDVTFDAILRVFQPENISEVMFTKITEQVDNKFSYVVKNGSNLNAGVYILYYDEDYGIKQAQ
ncbi:LysM peptidoglycan-binding domain-containing protein [Flavobacterium sp. MK4S-17]|uniref:PBP1 and LysM peptidoglycan-binding domain-containing protein n=1 Tax=Flavobacterium sp. MK4S-17 TaxID=2543737 RepID=UPI0013568599|nr:LysM peptidoglycan-binding domain-containing protein [Flavobacterium sp. MK4S-17]